MSCAIISVGDEILSGRTVDTNSTWLCSKLNSLGIKVIRAFTVPDEGETIVNSLSDAFRSADIVIMTGGLGPTDDDKTRAAIADYAGVPLKTDDSALSKIKKKFADRDMKMPENVSKEAILPDGAQALENRVGIAPGIYTELDGGKHIIALPGVPGEMKTIFHDNLMPILRRIATTMNRWVEKFYTTGIPESSLAEKVADALDDLGTERLAFYPSQFGVEVRLTIDADQRSDLWRKEIIDQVTQPWCYSRSEKSLTAIIADLMGKKVYTLATAESCTGGLLSSRIVDIPGASDFFSAGAVSYSNEAKENILGVKHETLLEYGAVSAETAAEMADGAAKLLNADFALSTTGIAGPTGGTPEKPVGLVFYGLHTAEKTYVRKNRFVGGRDDHRHRTSQAVLFMLWLHLNGKYEEHPWADGSEEISV